MPRKTDVQLKLRFNEPLRKKLEAAAKENHRSMNTEIVHRLEATFSPEFRQVWAGVRGDVDMQITALVRPDLAKLLDQLGYDLKLVERKK
jgi:hypothetical protein